MAKRVALWLTSSSMPRLKLFEDAPPSTNTKMHVTLVSALVRQPKDIEMLVDKVKKLSATLKFNNVSVQPPIGANLVPVLEGDKSRVCIPLAASIELENLHEISAQLITPEEVRASVSLHPRERPLHCSLYFVPLFPPLTHVGRPLSLSLLTPVYLSFYLKNWEPKLVLAQGAGAPALLERLKEDPNALKLEFTIDTIEGTRYLKRISNERGRPYRFEERKTNKKCRPIYSDLESLLAANMRSGIILTRILMLPILLLTR